MNKYLKQTRFWLAALLTLWIAGSGCTSTDRKILPADVLFKKARKQIKIEDYEKAQQSLTQLMEDSPDSKERIIAQLLLGEVHYRQEQYEEAKFNFDKFVEQYPAHKLAPRAQYWKAMSDYDQVDIALRDQTFTHNAKAEFEKLLRIYPKSSYARKANRRIKECVGHLAQNELEIGRFYYRTNSFQSAILRFQTLLADYPDQKFIDEVIFLLGDSFYEEQNFKNARVYFIRLLREYPRSEFKEDARSRLRDLKEQRL